MYAICFASGEIIFSSQKDHIGAIVVAHGPGKVLRHRIEAVARHAYDGETLLVPGIPEAVNQADGVEALLRFQKWIRPSFERDGLSVP